MKMMKELAEFFVNRERESDLLAEELTKHKAKWPGVKHQYDELDQICIGLAGRLSAAHVAGSPTWISIDADLRSARAKRDDITRTYARETQRLHTALAGINREPIYEFTKYCLGKLKSIGQAFRQRQGEVFDSVEDRGKYKQSEVDVKYATITDNAAAIEAARETIVGAIKQVRNLESSASLRQVQAEIGKCLAQFDGFDFSPMNEHTVTLGMLRADRQDRLPDITPDGAKVAELSNRISRLEKS